MIFLIGILAGNELVDRCERPSMLKGEVIIFNTSMPLRNYMKRRPSHYAEILSKENQVVNLSSTSIRNLFKFRKSVPWQEQIFFRFPGTRSRWVRSLNEWRYRRFTKKVVKKLKQKPILWHFYSGNYVVMRDLDSRLSILEICDDTPEFFAGSQKRFKEVEEKEQQLARDVDIVFTVSETLRQKRRLIRPDIHVVRNGVTAGDFEDIPNLGRSPSDELFSMKNPIVGYVGAVAHWLDFELVEGTAKQLSDVEFVFLGRIAPDVLGKVEGLRRLANLHFLGERPYEELPAYLKYFDLTHIPFVLSPLVLGVNPIKLYEYLAAGKRVVSTPLPEVVMYESRGLVETAKGSDNYSKAIRKMLEQKPADFVSLCQRIAAKNSWTARVQSACDIVSAFKRSETI